MVSKVSGADKPPKTITISLDGEDLELPDRDTTPNEILRTAGLDLATHYLVKIHGKDQDSYQGRGDETIKVHNKEKFISLSTGPTPTS
jgi:hypothetical protein